MSDRTLIVEARRRKPLPELMADLGLSEHAKKSARCPFHEDGSNSFSIYQKDGAWAWKCFATCGGGDEISFLETHRQLAPGSGVRPYLELAGVNGTNGHKPTPTFDWDNCWNYQFESVANAVAAKRGYSVEFVMWLHEQRLVGLHTGKVAFPVHNENRNVVGCHYNVVKGTRSEWFYHPHGTNVRPLVFGDTVTADAALVFESQWDAFAVADKAGMHLANPPRLLFVVTRGAGNGRLVKGTVPAGKIVYAWKQNDEEKNGKRAGDEWLKDVVRAAGVEVRWVKTPEPHKDANDWSRAGATDDDFWEAVKAAGDVGEEKTSKTFSQLAVTPSPAVPATDSEKVYYDIARKEYLVPDARGRWIANNEAQFKRRCKIKGISTRAGDNVFHSPFDTYVTDLQHNSGVDFVGPLAGYPAGPHDYEGRRLLVTSGPNMPEPISGEWSTLRQVFENVLGDPEHDQTIYWHGWVKTTIEALLARRHKPGQAVVFVGPAEGGKSLMQDLTTVIFGGREAKPYRYMTGTANFNGEMVGAEHLRIGDENPHTDLRARRSFGAQIKNIVVEATQRIEAKFYEAMILKPFWRLSISLNDEPENLLVLPPLDEHTLDKLILFKAHKLPMPMPTATPEQKAAFWTCLVSEIPHYMHWLLHDFAIPPDLVSQRYGITHFHHPEIKTEVEGFEPWRELRALIDAEIFHNPTTEPWRGSAEELERELTHEHSRVRRAAQKLLDWRGSSARYLGRLAKSENPSVFEARTNQRREWIIKPPSVTL